MSKSSPLRPLVARGSRPLRGEALVAGDKSISHRALILGALAISGAPVVIPALLRALASGAPLTLASLGATAAPPVDVPAALRAIEVASGCAADYDAWLTGAAV